MRTIKINILCDFPVLSYHDIDYKVTTVRKLSLPAYMMLVFIKGAPTDSFLCQELGSAGISSELYDIFSDELYELAIRHKMLNLSQSVKTLDSVEKFREAFEGLRISDFTLTQRGELFLRDRAICGGYEMKRLRQLYYNPVKRQFTLKAESLGKHTEIPFKEMKGGLTEPNGEFIRDYLNSIKDRLKMDKNSAIVEMDDCIDTEWQTQSKRLNIEISQDGAIFSCDDDSYLEYLTRCYQSKWISALVADYTGAFKFCARKSTDFEDTVEAVKNYVFPKDINLLLNRRCDYLITGRYISVNNKERASRICVNGDAGKRILDSVAADCELIMVSGRKAWSYHAVNLKVPRCGLKGLDFTVDLLLEKDADASGIMALYHKLENNNSK